MNARRQFDWDEADFALADEVADVSHHYQRVRPDSPRPPAAVEQRVRRLARSHRRTNPLIDWLFGQVAALALAVLLLFAVGVWVLWLEQKAPVQYGSQVFVVTARDSFSDFSGDRALVSWSTDARGHATGVQVQLSCRMDGEACVTEDSADFDRLAREAVVSQRYPPGRKLVAVVLLEHAE